MTWISLGFLNYQQTGVFSKHNLDNSPQPATQQGQLTTFSAKTYFREGNKSNNRFSFGKNSVQFGNLLVK